MIERVKNFLRRRNAQRIVLLSAPWTRLDRENLGRFLRGDTGKKMVQRLRAFEAANAIAGAKDMLHPSHSAGRSVGYGELLEHMISLSSSCHEAQELAIGAPGAAPANETPEQKEAREMQELIARLAP